MKIDQRSIIDQVADLRCTHVQEDRVLRVTQGLDSGIQWIEHFCNDGRVAAGAFEGIDIQRDTLCAIEMFGVFGNALPLDDASRRQVASDIQDLEMSFGCLVLNAEENCLSDLSGVPDILEAFGLVLARCALLYRLGHEEALRKDGSIPPDETPEAAYRLFSGLANQPLAHQTPRHLLIFGGKDQVITSVVLGVRIECHFSNTDTSAALAETLLSSIEAFLATSLNARLYPHAGRVVITVTESGVETPEFRISDDRPEAEIIWPQDQHLNDCIGERSPQNFLFEFIVHLLGRIAVIPDVEAFMDDLLGEERAPDRALAFSPASICYSRIVKRPRSVIGDWGQHIKSRYELLPEHPTFEIDVDPPDEDANAAPSDDVRASPGIHTQDLNRHTDVKIDSVIDLPLWDKAGWRGVGFVGTGHHSPPVMGLLFDNFDMAEKIFAQWHDRFGVERSDDYLRVAIVRGISKSNPAHYRVCISPQIVSSPADMSASSIRMVLTRIQTMEPASTENLDRFLTDFGRHNAFTFAALDSSPSGIPLVLEKFALRRTSLIVTDAWRVDPTSSESFAIFHDDEVVIPPDVEDAPVLDVLKLRRSHKN